MNKKTLSENSTSDLNSSITDLIFLEQNKKLRRKQVSLITSHLIGRFSINPYDTQLALVLSYEVKNNNFDALFSWVDNRIEETGYDNYQTWDSSLENS